MSLHTKILQFNQGFKITFHAEIEEDLDLSFDETDEVDKMLDSGEWVAFCAHVEVSKEGIVLSDQYLGQCIYTNYESFYTLHKGDYFADMVNEGIEEAKAVIERLTK